MSKAKLVPERMTDLALHRTLYTQLITIQRMLVHHDDRSVVMAKLDICLEIGQELELRGVQMNLLGDNVR
jgi:hypothetical protein